MADAQKWSFPHPLLAPGVGDVDSTLNVLNPRVEFGVTVIWFDFDLVLDDQDMIAHLNSGRVALRARYRSGSAFTFQSVTPEPGENFGDRRRYRIQIEQGAVRGRITLEVMLVALEAIQHYSLTNQSSVFSGAHFSIAPFDIVGYAYRVVIDAKKNHDPLNPPFDSFFRFEVSEAVKHGFDLDYGDSEQIAVRMAPSVFAAFQLQEARPEIQVGMIMLPALIGALTQIQKPDDQPTDYGWFTALTRLVDDRGLANMEPYLQAQRILEDPVKTALVGLSRFEESA